jgi:hypothetical protein
MANMEVGREVNTEKTKCIFKSCTENAEEITTYRLLIHPLKVWYISHVWEKRYQIKIACMKKLRLD